MAYDLKSATPDTTIAASSFLFGADSQAASAPSVFAIQNVIDYIFGTANLFYASNVIDQRNSTTAQTFRVYNTYTDASNYERGVFDFSTTSNVLTIGTGKAGTGSTRAVQLIVGDVNLLDYGVTNAGMWNVRGGGASTAQMVFVPNSGSAMSLGAANGGSGLIVFGGTTAPAIGFHSFDLSLVSTARFSWTISSSSTETTRDTGLGRSAAGVVEVNDGTNGNYRDLRARNVRTNETTVASLTAAATAGAGARSFVSDANATTFLSTVAGGGANKVPVVSDGTNWLIG